MASQKVWWSAKAGKPENHRGRLRRHGLKSGSSPRARRRFPHLEALESRLVLSALITYNAPSTGSNLTLRVAEVGGAADLQLFDDLNMDVVGEAVLNQDIQVQITGSPQASDLLTVDLALAGGATAEPIAVTFNGGLPAMNPTDKVTIGGAGPLYEPASFALQSNAPILVSGALQTVGDINLTASQVSDAVVTALGAITADGVGQPHREWRQPDRRQHHPGRPVHDRRRTARPPACSTGW